MTTPQASAQRLFTSLSTVLRQMDKSVSPLAVHRLRTGARRVEAMAAHLRGKVTGPHDSALEEIRAIRKKSGKVRDLDVQLALLRKINKAANPEQFAALHGKLVKDREDRAQKLYKEVRLLKKKKWAARLEKLREQIAQGKPKDWKTTEPLLTAKEKLQRLRTRYPDSLSMVDPEELHKIRIEIKRIRYTAELAGRAATARAFTAALEHAQDAVGIWHDWLTLAEAAEEVLNNYVSSSILLELRSQTTSAYSAAIQAVTDVLGRDSAPPKKAPRSSSVKQRTARSA
jgi:triphosphatase